MQVHRKQILVSYNYYNNKIIFWSVLIDLKNSEFFLDSLFLKDKIEIIELKINCFLMDLILHLYFHF